jgi:hypothetical protein
VHPDSRDFTASGVNARQTFDTKSIDPKVGHRTYQNFLKIANITMNVFPVGAQVDDWVANDLSETMVCHLTAAISFKQSYTTAFEFILV